eukprot:2327099-Alexandrium_andersonii.AAC.1
MRSGAPHDTGAPQQAREPFKCAREPLNLLAVLLNELRSSQLLVGAPLECWSSSTTAGGALTVRPSTSSGAPQLALNHRRGLTEEPRSRGNSRRGSGTRRRAARDPPAERTKRSWIARS